MIETLDLFKALSDEIRLRIVRAVSVSELSVAELVGVLGLPQSTVSRHLKPLRDVGLVEARRDGTSVYYRRGHVAQDPALSRLLNERLNDVVMVAEDLASVHRIMDMRRAQSRSFFDKIAGSYGTLTQPGGGWQALAAGLAAGYVGQDVADLGAGEGHLTLLLARFASRVIAVDQSVHMLDELRNGAERAGVSGRVEVAQGDIESIPLPPASVDAAFLSQVLHHVAQPSAAVAEGSRILRRHGRLIVLDLVRHDQEWVRKQWADLWFGFEPDDLRQWMQSAGLKLLVTDQLPGSIPELSVLLTVAEKC